MGRPDDALSALAPVSRDHSSNVSPYGAMQVQWVLYAAAMLKKDDGAARKAYEFLSQHRTDAPETFQDVLLWENRPDESARYLIERLHDPLARGPALRDLQIYAEKPLPPLEATMQLRLRELADRPDVRAAVAEVGVIERFSIPWTL